MSGIINESTSVIQVYAPGVVYLSSTTIPGQLVTVMDATGIISTPQSVSISTVGTSAPSLFIQQRFGYLTLISQDSNTWVPVNCNSFPTSSSVYYKGLDAFTIQTNTLNAYSHISTTNVTNRSTEIFSTATFNQRAFMSSININSFQRYTSTSVTDPRVTNTGAAHLYNSMNTIGTFNIRGNISTMGNFNVLGNVSSKLGTIYVGGDLTTMGSIRGQRGLQTSVLGVSTTGAAVFNQAATIADDVFVSQSLSTNRISTVDTSAYAINATSSIVFTTSQAIQYRRGFLNFLNIPATIPSISSLNITSSNAIATSNIFLESFSDAPLLTRLTLSTAQIQNPAGSLSLSTLAGNSFIGGGSIYVPQLDVLRETYTHEMTMNDAPATRSTVVYNTVVPASWNISSLGTNGTLTAQNKSISTNLLVGSLIYANTLNTDIDNVTNFNISTLQLYSTIFLSSATLLSLVNVNVNNTGGTIIASSKEIGSAIYASTIKTDLISSPNSIYFNGQSTASISTGTVSSITAQNIITSSLSFTKGTFGTTMAYSTINPSTP